MVKFSSLIAVVLTSLSVSSYATSHFDEPIEWFDTLEDLKAAHSESSGVVFKYESGEYDPWDHYDGKFFIRTSFPVSYDLTFIGRGSCFIGDPAKIEFVPHKGRMLANKPVLVTHTIELENSENEMSFVIKDEFRYFKRDKPKKRPFKVESSQVVTIKRCP